MNYVALDRARARSRWPWRELRRVASLRREPNRLSDKRLLSLSAHTGVQPRPDDGGRQLPSEETVANYWVVRPNDLVFNPMWAIEGGVAVSDIEGAVSTAYRIYKFSSAVFPRYAHHFFRSRLAIEQYGLLVRGVTTFDRSVTREDFEVMPMPLPSINDQRAIADYLDTETARIDALITKKRRMIELLNDRLTSSANHTVAGDLTADAVATPMVTIPLVQAGWAVLRNKVFMREVNRPSITGDEEMLSVSHLTGVTPRSEKTVYMFEAESNVGYKLVQPGDLVINTMWAWMGAAGVSRSHGIVSPAYGVYAIDRDRVNPEWVDLLIRTPAYITEMTRFSRGVTSSRLRLYPDEFLRLPMPVPPLDTQDELVKRQRRATLTSARLIAPLQRQINLLAEHRQALITAAVTGEVRVPGAAA